MRSVASILGCLEPETEENVQTDIAIRLTALFGPALLYWHHFHNSGIRIKTQTDPSDSIAENFLKLLSQEDEKPSKKLVETLDKSLILYAEHDFNASVFGARVTIST